MSPTRTNYTFAGINIFQANLYTDSDQIVIVGLKKSTQKIYDSYNMQYNFNKNRKKIALVKPASMVVFAGYYMKQNKISRENARNTCVKQHL